MLLLGGPIPKSWIGEATLWGSSPYTGLPSIIQNRWGLTGLRAVGRVSSSAFFGYGLAMAGVEVYCLATF